MNVFNYWKNLYNWKNPLNWWRLPGCWCRAVKWAWQRATKGFSDLDCWNLHNFYLEVFEGSLKHLAERNIGCPKKYYDSSRLNDECWKWREHLFEIADCFKEAHEAKTSYINPYEDEYLENFHMAFERTSKGYYTLKDGEVDTELLEKYKREEKNKFFHRNINLVKGLDMLKEIFWYLWD